MGPQRCFQEGWRPGLLGKGRKSHVMTKGWGKGDRDRFVGQSGVGIGCAEVRDVLNVVRKSMSGVWLKSLTKWQVISRLIMYVSVFMDHR